VKHNDNQIAHRASYTSSFVKFSLLDVKEELCVWKLVYFF